MLFSLLLAFSLSLDALGIGLSYGLRSIRFRPSALLLLTIEAFLMMELFLFAGRRLAAVFPALCLQGMGQGKRKETSPLHSPSLCDKNASSLIEPQEALLLGLLLSVDSFAIGLSAAAGGINVTLLPLVSALFQTFFLALGEKCGTRLILSPAPKESLWSLLSGGILILLAVLQLLDKK